jgi:fructoselysine-6-P-deglycase FrlB-like protein
MDAKGFSFDITQKAALLRSLATHRYDWSSVASGQILLLGMGSSHFANDTVTRLLNRDSLSTRAMLASVEKLPRLDGETTVVAVSAGGTSVETLAALAQVPQGIHRIGLTNQPDSAISSHVDSVMDLRAGVETGGVASLTYLATLVSLLQLVDLRTGTNYCSHLNAAADALDDIVERQDEWLPAFHAAAIGEATTYFAAPLERLASAQQSALMLREGPRHAAAAAETGDWSHIDVYLTKTYDYRLVVLAGSVWETQMLEWTTKRASTVIAVGADVPGAALNLRYRNDDNEVVRMLAETTFAELLAAAMWREQ